MNSSDHHPFFDMLEPHSWLPPVQSWQGASESLFVANDHPWITPSEQTGLNETPDYAASLAWLEKLCAVSPRLTLREFGRSAQGRPLCLVIASAEPAHTADSLREGGKPTLLVQAGILPGEIEGYILAPLAEMMLQSDPELKTEFEAKLNADFTFANDSQVRLQWFYQRSPFHDIEYLRYPVGVER